MNPDVDGYFEHPLIRKTSILKRDYQVRISAKALNQPTLVVLPTGLGKTVIALIFIAERISQGEGPVLMLAPTKPLVEQHRRFLEDHLEGVSVGMLTGEVAPAKRKESYEGFQVMVSTPQVVKNDIISGELDISRYRTMVFDEAHRAVGDYPYVFTAEMFYRKHPLGSVLGLTASPGHDISRIYEVCTALGIENIEVRVDSDPDVKPYIQDMEVQMVKVEVSQGMRSLISVLERMFLERASRLQRMGVLRKGAVPSVKELLAAGGRIREMIARGGPDSGPLFQAISLQAQAMKVAHAMELAETQGAEALYQYLDRLLKETSVADCSKATKSVVSDGLFRTALNMAAGLRMDNPPKVDALERFVKQKLREDPGSRIIAFTHYRDTASQVLERLEKYVDIGIRPIRFVGQASRGEDQGLTQRKQRELLDGFREGTHNVLIATSVAEEGLDIPGADLVIFYEPIPSEIRTIQRRGRTGRHSAGKVIVLMSRETRDIAYSFSARDKEQKMERQLLSLRRMLKMKPIPSKRTEGEETKRDDQRISATLDEYSDEVVRISEGEGSLIEVDQREMPSSVVEELIRSGFKVKPLPLGEGDYRISSRLVVERKTAQDLSDSLVDGRLFEQVTRLRENFERPMMVIEGDDPFNKRNIKKNALYGALASITIDYNIPVMFTTGPEETAEFLMVLARRENKERRPQQRSGRAKKSGLREVQIGTLSGLPGISTVLAGKMISHFGSLEKVFTASEKELTEVEGIGSRKAREIRAVLSGDWKG
ncbi:MAG: DEAD/DEAH box helicase [Candidatus Thermoplasmatota archaeon]|nr:DEAD/DEAH box helicase [Candidatus Thermoplasmatota archaeon]